MSINFFNRQIKVLIFPANNEALSRGEKQLQNKPKSAIYLPITNGVIDLPC